MRKQKTLSLVVASLFLATLWGCGSNMDSGGDQTGPGTDIANAAKAGSYSCKVCHTSIVDQGWTGSAHDKSDDVAGCEGCHGGGQYHKGIGPIAYPSPGPEQCSQCHELAAIGHTDNPATATTIEGLVVKTANVTGCQDCHYSDHNPVLTINEEWVNSGHGGFIGSGPVTEDTAPAWVHYDWDSSGRASCQRCHTSTGISNFLTDPTRYVSANNDFSHLSGWTSTNKTSGQNEMLYCWGCHSDVSTGALRNPGAITEVYTGVNSSSTGTTGTSATVVYPDAAASNVCMGCHLGREIGQNIKNITDADGKLGFVNSHYLTAGGTVFNTSGYEYAGQTYANFGFHKNIGVGEPANNFNTGSSGPCVSCHMSADSGHTYNFVTKDADGNIEDNNSPLCTKCHFDMDAGSLNSAKEKFHGALEELDMALQARGIYFYEAHPYFYAGPNGTGGAFTDWESVATTLGVGLAADSTGKGWKNVMGAAFNYNLFEHDPGAYAHNSDYALKLIADSIDFLSDGIIDGDASIAATLIGQGMNLASGAGYSPIHNAPVALAILNPAGSATTCSACHPAAPHFGGNRDAAPQWVANGLICADCHSDNNISANQEVLTSYADSAHGDVAGIWTHDETGGSCQRCHTTRGYLAHMNAQPVVVWLPTDTLEVLTCNACHSSVDPADPARHDPGAFTGAWADSGVTVNIAFPDADDSNLCVRCHSGRQVGDNLKNIALNFTSLNEIRPHYLAAAGVVFAETGYHFDLRDYTIPAGDTHVSIGLGTTGNAAVDAFTSGPCTTCHYNSNNGSHTLSPLTTYAPGDVSLNPVCVNCHPTRGAGTNAETTWLGTDAIAATLQGTTHKARYQAALEALRVQLAVKGFNYYDGRHYKIPIVNPVTDAVTANRVRNWGNQGNAGAGFNYNLLIHEPGGVAHNRRYTRRLIYDAIDWLDDGNLNYSVSATLAALNPSVAVYKDSATAYLIDSDPVGNLGTAAERY